MSTGQKRERYSAKKRNVLVLWLYRRAFLWEQRTLSTFEWWARTKVISFERWVEGRYDTTWHE